MRTSFWTGLLAATASAGCSFLISLNDVAPDNPEGGGGMTQNNVDAGETDVSTADVGSGDARTAVDARAVVDADAGSTGSTRPDASNPMSGSDGGRGPDGGAACADPMYPVPCPAIPQLGVVANCWTAGTDCSSLRNCGGVQHGCSARYAYDCSQNQCLLVCNPTCTCTDPAFPVLCSGVGSPADGGTPTDCWTPGTDCSTVTVCSGQYHACSAGYRFDCNLGRCVAANDGGVRDGGNDAPADARITCEAGLTACGNRCVNLQNDATNCGACANICPGGNACLAGQCCAPPAAGGACNLPACGCAAGSVCTPDTQATGLQCFVSGNLPNGADCTGQVRGGCASGLGCFGGICAEFCGSSNDCPLIDGARFCTGTQWAPNMPISGVMVCRRTCDPVTPQAPRAPLLRCPPGFGCSPAVAPGASDCFQQPGTGVTGSICAGDSDCSPGYFCDNTTTNTCLKLCSSNTDCVGGATCALGSMLGVTPLFAGTKEIGVCSN